eukprot:365900-Chlamydomonas_euryale.AAC.23
MCRLVAAGPGVGSMCVRMAAAAARLPPLFSPFSACTPHLRLRRQLAREQQPQHALGQRLAVWLCSRQFLLQLWDGVAAETDALVGIQQGRLPQHALRLKASAAAHVGVRCGGGKDAERGDIQQGRLPQHALRMPCAAAVHVRMCGCG